jgi:hypothetical protein
MRSKLPSNIHYCFPIYLDGVLHQIVKARVERKNIGEFVSDVEREFDTLGNLTEYARSNEACRIIWKYLRSQNRLNDYDLLRNSVYHSTQLGDDLAHCKAIIMLSDSQGLVNIEGFTSMAEYREALDKLYNSRKSVD